jgi:hypothetical protein
LLRVPFDRGQMQIFMSLVARNTWKGQRVFVFSLFRSFFPCSSCDLGTLWSAVRTLQIAFWALFALNQACVGLS